MIIGSLKFIYEIKSSVGIYCPYFKCFSPNSELSSEVFLFISYLLLSILLFIF